MDKKALLEGLTWNLLSILTTISRVLPIKAALTLGASTGGMVRLASKRRVDAAIGRCCVALGVSKGEAKRIVVSSYRNIGRSVVEFMRFPGESTENLFGRINVNGVENLNKAFQRGKGVVVLTAHIGNWEYAAAWMALKGYPMNAIGAEQRDDRITRTILETRAIHGVKTISKGFDLKSAIRCLRDGKLLGVLLDQDMKKGGFRIPFLGIPANTPIGPIKLAQKTGSAIVPLLIIRDSKKPWMHTLDFFEGFSVPEGGDDVISDYVLRCNDIISSWIKSNPEQWMWLYPRWESTGGP